MNLVHQPTTASNLELRTDYIARVNSSAGTLLPTYFAFEEPRKPIGIEPQFPSIAVLDVEYEPMISSVPKYEISIEAEQFISKQKKAV